MMMSLVERRVGKPRDALPHFPRYPSTSCMEDHCELSRSTTWMYLPYCPPHLVAARIAKVTYMYPFQRMARH